MNSRKLLSYLILVLAALLILEPSAHARKRRRSYSGPPPTHPVILWSRTMDESTDVEQRKVAAFKLSQYSQPIFQTKVITTLMKCTKDPEVQIKVLCTKALGRVRSASQEAAVRETLVSLYGSDAYLKNTVVRTLVARKDSNASVQKLLADALMKTEDTDEILVLLSYFEGLTTEPADLTTKLVELYARRSNVKVRRSIAKVLESRANGEDNVIELLSQCAQERDTPLALNCLAGLQSQAKKDTRAWAAIQKTIMSDDPDVLLATLDVIDALPENKNSVISHRLLELVEEAEDPDIQEKSVLALGICGDESEATVNALQKVFKDEKTEEATRIAAALTLGKQGAAFQEGPKELLSGCAKESTSQSLKTACQLGLNELAKLAKAAAAANPPAPASASATDEKSSKTN